MKKLFALLLALTMVLGMTACAVPADTTPPVSGSTAPSSVPASSVPASSPSDPTDPTDPTAPSQATDPGESALDPAGHYNSMEDVALYIHLYGCLPQNYVTKDYAKNTLGCSTSRVQDYWPDGAIGGDVFQNREGRLPAASGRVYYECDIDTWGKYSRGTKRIVFSNDGLVYYTADHYNSFTLLYGEP